MYETSAVWTITGPDGTVVQFNNGGPLILQDVSGWDSPNIRQNLADLPEADGSVAGDFFMGGRPVTLSGLLNYPDAASRNNGVVTFQRALRALRGDLTVQSQPQGLPAMQAKARLENFRVTGGFVKQFQLGLVCPDPRLYSVFQNVQTATSSPSTSGAVFPWVFPVNFGGGTGGTANLTAPNAGNIDSYPVVRVTGPVSNPQVTNATTGRSVYVDNVTLAGGEWIDIDMANRTVVSSAAANLYARVRFPGSTWWALQPGSNLIQLWASSSSAGVQLDVTWRDAWA